MKISYAIPVKDEFVEIQRLLNFLLEHKDREDEIVVLFDSKNGSREVETYLRKKNVERTLFRWHSYEFDGHFANMKNHLTSLCSGDWIVQLDADEMVGEKFIPWVKGSIEANPEVHAFYVPRINTVEGLTPEHIEKWRWNVNEKGWVNFPDLQQRIYVNNGVVKWKNKVHEVLEGNDFFGIFPNFEGICILHPKDIKRQELQNNYYETL
jgi:hypothetical protein